MADVAITLEQMRAAVAREIGLRERVYPKWVAAKKMSQEKADHEIAAMEAVQRTLASLAQSASAASDPTWKQPKRREPPPWLKWPKEPQVAGGQALPQFDIPSGDKSSGASLYDEWQRMNIVLDESDRRDFLAAAAEHVKNHPGDQSLRGRESRLLLALDKAAHSATAESKDAARYRWWRANWGTEYDSPTTMKIYTLINPRFRRGLSEPQGFDAAIDAAIAASSTGREK